MFVLSAKCYVNYFVALNSHSDSDCIPGACRGRNEAVIAVIIVILICRVLC